jgi:hypothetical protein
MGSYAGLYFDALQIDWSKNAAPELWPVLFAPEHFFRRAPSNAHRDVRRALNHEWRDSDWSEYFYFRADTRSVWDRLAVLGYCEALVRDLWAQSRTESIRNYRAHTDNGGILSGLADDMEAQDFDAWCEAVRAESAGKTRFHDYTIDDDPIADFAAKMIALKPKTVWADVTDVYESGYLSANENLHDSLEPSRERVELAFSKILILTEGRSDQRLIETALRRFYPHLADLYSFVDFEGFHVEGGASPVGRLLKGLAGAGLSGRIIAIFDNDAAGHETLLSLKAVRFPDTIRVLTLPPNELARRYPTIGPTGLQVADVNGAACAIELYLGRRSLTVDGSLLSVRWSQWNPRSERYQGELENKAHAAEKFLAELDKRRSPAALRRAFPEMDALLQSIFAVYA